MVRVVLEKTNQDQLLKIWNNTSSTYKLSFVVLLTGVEIDSRRERRFTRVTDVAIGTAQTGGEESGHDHHPRQRRVPGAGRLLRPAHGGQRR